MSQPQPDPTDRTAQILLIIAGIGSPAVFGFVWTQTQNLWQALGLMLVYGLVIIFAGLITGVWGRVRPSIEEGAAKEILHWLTQPRDRKHRKPYLQYLIYRHRTFDVKVLSTQGPYALELKKIFVDLNISPEAQPGSNPVPKTLRTGGHSIWRFLKTEGVGNLAILGAPGSGKTTLLKFVTIKLASPQSSETIPDKLPVLLVLRDHYKTIIENPSIRLVEVIQRSLEMMDEKPPDGWFERHLKEGHCLIMFDGLDEIADVDQRRIVVKWVEAQMSGHGRNRFIITSRPYGYRSNPLGGVIQVEVRPFNREQIEQFVSNWYLANEILSYQRDDPGVRMEARKGADALMERIRTTPDIAELAVNPLLLTMIANVHRFRSSLPGRRVELYAEMCDVFLGKRDDVYGVANNLTPAQRESILQPLAYYMMLEKQREISLEDALPIIEDPLRQVPGAPDSTAFLQHVRDRSGILVERENGVFGFAHKTFQEFLTATYIQQEKLHNVLIQHLDEDWWHETIRLYCARMDATPIIDACLAAYPPPLARLTLALECASEALKLAPETQQYLDKIVEQDLESENPERRRLSADAHLSLRLRRLTRLDDNTYIDTAPITHAEFQLFLDEHPEYAPDHWEGTHFPKGEGKSVLVGLTPIAAKTFCKWLTQRQTNVDWLYRLPKREELDQSDSCWINEGWEITVAAPHIVQQTLEQWLLHDETRTFPVETKLRDHSIVLRYYAPTTRDTAKAFLSSLGLASARTNASDRDLDRAIASDLASARASAIALAIASALAIALALDRARASARASAIALDRASASDLISALDRDLDRASALDRARDLDHALDLASALVSALVSTLDRNRGLAPELVLYWRVAVIIRGYIELSMLLIGDEATISPVQIFKQAGVLTNFRQCLLAHAATVFDQQPRKLLFGINREWEEWDQGLNQILRFYATLAMLERRRRGEWQAFETLRIVKARRETPAKSAKG